MRSFRSRPGILALLSVIVAGVPALAQAPGYQNVGRAPTEEEVRKWDIAIGPTGTELPAGEGTALQGAVVYFARRCTFCHGANLEGTQYGPRLAGGAGTIGTAAPVRTIGSYWPFATTVWDYINRAMPRSPMQPGSLSPNEVYAVTAFLLYRSGIVKVDEVIDRESLPRIRMPNRDGFLPSTPDWIWYRASCRLGSCRP